MEWVVDWVVDWLVGSFVDVCLVVCLVSMTSCIVWKPKKEKIHSSMENDLFLSYRVYHVYTQDSITVLYYTTVGYRLYRMGSEIWNEIQKTSS